MIGFIKDKLYSYPFLFVFLFLISISAAMLFSRIFISLSVILLLVSLLDKRVFFVSIIFVVIMLALKFYYGECHLKRPFVGVVEDVRLSKSISLLVSRGSCKFYLFCSAKYDNIDVADVISFKARLKPKDTVRPSFRRYLDSLGVNYVGFAYGIRKSEFSSYKVFVKIRKRIEDEFHYFLSSDVEYFLDSSFLGDNKFKSKIKKDFVKTQTSHLLVVSGLHMGFVFGLFYLLLYRLFSMLPWIYKRFNLRILSSLFSLPFVSLYFLVAGFHIPAMRSFLMVLVFAFGVIFSFESASYNILFMIASIFVMINYKIILNPSFVLSFFMTFIAIFLYRLSFRRLQKYWFFLAFTVFMSLFSLPITDFYFGRFTPLSFLSNIIFIPLFGFVVVPLAFIGSLASFLPYSVFKVWLFDVINWIIGMFLKLEAFFALYLRSYSVKLNFYEMLFVYLFLFLSVIVLSKLLPHQNSPLQTPGQNSF
ncbi:ComEC/Rec2 family competence protein [Hippea maritima]|uniref:ComEC/Rec2-related protein n=1 Tax=Hippea maritima (strain ATCC 700847 / DSM 10411 / MH2) TaxID=760142 RepID=F2LXW6_HIPMA|nr:ComEC/Rec2 family competence protein [Hippea maritima]AEA33231.1 ComEC/Rec2-related protein [Hippea maritima DSM 10411]